VDQPSRSKTLRKFFCNGAQLKSHKLTEFWFSLFPFGFGKCYLYALGFMALVAGTPAHNIYPLPRKSYMMGRWIKGSVALPQGYCAMLHARTGARRLREFE
jgi:hypothetical protein